MAGPAAAVGAKAAAGGLGKARAAHAGASAVGGDDGASGGMLKLAIAAGAVGLGFLLLIISPFLLIGGASASTPACGTTSATGGTTGPLIEANLTYDEGPDDPPDMPPLEIATRIYVTGVDLKLDKRYILTALAVAMVEAGGGVTLTNIHTVLDGSSTGAFQQQAFMPWTARNRQNVAAAAHTFYEQAVIFDTGQPPGELAADVQRPLESLRYKYAEALPGAEEWLERVEANLKGQPAGSGSASGTCTSVGGPVGGSADFDNVETLYEPREYKTLPADVMAYGSPQQVDARIWENAVFLLREYDLKVTAARESGHATHGDGTALDIIPAGSDWVGTTERVARDLGWTPECAASGVAPVCPFSPAIHGIFYNGFENHGDPAHCSGTCPAHLHISWASSCYGCEGGALVEPREWVKAFIVGDESEDEPSPEGGGRGQGGGRRGGGGG